MAAYSRHSSDVDRALDGLGFSYLDGVPFRLDPRLESVSNYDFSRVNALTSQNLPSAGISEMCNDLMGRMGTLERQVLAQLRSLEAEEEAKRDKEKKEEEELEQKRIEEAKAKAEAEIEAEAKADAEIETKANAEAEALKEEAVEDNEYECIDNDIEDTSPADTETEPSTASISDVFPQVSSLPSVTQSTQSATSQQEPQAASSQTSVKNPLNINFSEFEAESDPFERAELQTINDMQELAAVLQTTAALTYPSSSQSTVYSTANSAAGSGQQFPPSFFYPRGAGQMPQHQYFFTPRPTQQPSYFPYHGQGALQQSVSRSHFGQSPGAGSEMKGSKSVGDIMAEINKEAEALEQMKLKGHQRKNSQTPPPMVSGSSSSSTHNALENWIPWPDIGQKSASNDVRQKEMLSELSPSSQAVCKQISEMGFSLERVVNGCKSLGDDRQKLINFCLMVDKILSTDKVKFAAQEVEYVVPIHNLDEDASLKHLRAFQRLEEFGFDRFAIHNALIDTNLDHDKALEKLLK